MERDYFKNLTDDELKKELAQINRELLDITKTYSFKSVLFFSDNIREQLEKMEDKEAFSDITDCIKRIEDIVLSGESLKERREETLSVRRLALENLRVMMSYSRLAGSTFDLEKRRELERIVDSYPFSTKSLEKEIKSAKAKLEIAFLSVRDDAEKNFKLMKALVERLPLSFTKERAFYFIKRSLKITLRNASEYQVALVFRALKNVLDYKRVKGYGEKFSSIYLEIEEISKNSEGNEKFKRLLLLKEKIESYLSLFGQTGYLTNILLTYLSVEREDSEEIKTVRGEFSALEALENESKKEFFERLNRNIKEDMKLHKNKLDSFFKVNQAAIFRKNLDLSDISFELSQMHEAIKYYADRIVVEEEILNLDKFIPVSKKDLRMKIDRLLGEMEDVLKDFDSDMQKILLSRVMLTLYLVFFNFRELMDYIDQVLSEGGYDGKLMAIKLTSLEIK